MYSFFVLGQIPGTDIVISFTMWLLCAMLILGLYAERRYRQYIKQLIANQAPILAPTIGKD